MKDAQGTQNTACCLLLRRRLTITLPLGAIVIEAWRLSVLMISPAIREYGDGVILLGESKTIFAHKTAHNPRCWRETYWRLSRTRLNKLEDPVTML